MAGELEGKVALVTGAGSGMGQAVALRFAREGAAVVAADISDEGGCETVAMIKEIGGSATFAKTDVSRSADVRATVAAVISAFGRLDVVVNGAGIESAGAPTGDYPEDSWAREISINLTGTFLVMKYAIPELLKDGGTIVNIASIVALKGSPGSGAYCASKAGVVGLTKATALEYASKGIRVNALCPGSTATPMSARMRARRSAPPVESPLGRQATPEEQAEAALFLASDRSSFITGIVLPVDGGNTAK